MSVRIKEEPHDELQVEPMQIDDDQNDEKENKDDDIDTDTDDPIVEEIDVLLSPTLARQLYLLQYPGRPLNNNNKDDYTITSAQIKPRHNMLCIDDSFHSQTIPVTTHLCLGKLDNTTKQLTLIPVNHISQMRPSFQHLDEQFDQDNDDNDNIEDSAKRDKQQRPVTFQRKESERAAAARKSSYAFKKASEDAEAWVELAVHNETNDNDDDELMIGSNDQSSSSKQIRNETIQKIHCTNPDQCCIALPDPKKKKHYDYIQSLNYNINTVDDTDTSTTDNILKSLVSKVTIALKKGGPVPYSILKSALIITSDDDDEEEQEKLLLTALNVCGINCRGNWCLHSKFMKLPTKLQRIRTFALYILQEYGTLHRNRLHNAFPNSDSGQIKYIITSIAKQERINGQQRIMNNNDDNNNAWTLKVDDDKIFIEQKPNIINLHNKYWNRQRERFQEQLQLYIKINISNDE